MKRRPIMILALAMASGGLAWYLANGYLRAQAMAAPVEPPAVTQVAVAARDLPGGTVLGPDDVRLIEWPAAATPPGFLSDPSGLVGQGLLFAVKENEPLMAGKLAGGATGGLASVIPAGMRAISVKVDEVIAVAGFVVPGTRVDVLVTLTPSDDRPGTTRVVLQNIKVLAAGQSFEPSSEGKPQDASVITLLVTPAEAELITLASNEGRIQLALRNTLDEVVASTRGVYSTALGGGSAPPPPAPPQTRTSTPAAAPRAAVATPRSNGPVVEIYHGSARTVTAF